MKCQSCGSENSGVKLNGKLYCANCGEALQKEALTPEPFEAPKAARINKEGQLITEGEVRKLEAEEEVLDLIEDEAKTLKTKKSKTKVKKAKKEKKRVAGKIVKHNRTRVGHQKGPTRLSGGDPKPVEPIFVPEDNRPEPEQVTEPFRPIDKEAVIPIQIEETPASFAFYDKDKAREIKESKERKQQALTGFLKANAGKLQKNRKEEKKKKGRFKIIFFGILVFFVFAALGFFAYVNLWYFNPQNVITRAETTASFAHPKPSYIPFGYKPSIETIGERDSILYAYDYLPEKSKHLTIKISKSNETDGQSWKIIGQGHKEFTGSTHNGLNLWFADNDSLYFYKDKLLYQIESSATISEEELTKVADGLN